MQRFIEGYDIDAKRCLVITDLAKEYNVSDEYDTLANVTIESSGGKILARITCEKRRLKEVILQLK